MSRPDFAACLEELQRARAAWSALHDKTHPIQVKHRNAAAEAWKAHVLTPGGKPKKVPLAEDGHPDLYRICEKVGDAIVQTYTAPVVAEAHALYAELQANVERLKLRADELGAACTVEKGGEWRRLGERTEWEFSTQTCPGVYARNAADSMLDAARAAGIETRLVPGSKCYYAEVLVQTPLDVEIVRRLPGVSLREWVRLCWKRGANPRVMNPYLPHGYEEREGLDYFGNDLRAKAGA